MAILPERESVLDFVELMINLCEAVEHDDADSAELIGLKLIKMYTNAVEFGHENTLLKFADLSIN